jgi:hypothetical protein
MNYELFAFLNFILKRSNSKPPNCRREQVTVLGKNQKKFKPGCKRKKINQDIYYKKLNVTRIRIKIITRVM